MNLLDNEKPRILNLKKIDIYGLDSIFLSELKQTENYFEVNELNQIGLSFLILKAILYLNQFGEKVFLKLNQKLYLELIKKKRIELIKEFFELESILNLKLVEENKKEIFFKKELSFLLEEKSNNEEIYMAGGILKQKKEVQTLISEKYLEHDLKNRKGKFFIRTESHSFLYPIGKSKTKNFFIQEKNPIGNNFLFYIIKLENEVK